MCRTHNEGSWSNEVIQSSCYKHFWLYHNKIGISAWTHIFESYFVPDVLYIYIYLIIFVYQVRAVGGIAGVMAIFVTFFLLETKLLFQRKDGKWLFCRCWKTKVVQENGLYFFTRLSATDVVEEVCVEVWKEYLRAHVIRLLYFSIYWLINTHSWIISLNTLTILLAIQSHYSISKDVITPE